MTRTWRTVADAMTRGELSTCGPREMVGLLSQDDVIRAAARRRSPRLARSVMESLSMICEAPGPARAKG